MGLYQQLLKVYGRLNLITAHTNAAAQRSAAAEDGEDAGEADDGVPAPEVMFEDGSDAEPEAEDPFAANDGEDDDDEDDEDDDGLDDDGGFDDAGDDDLMGIEDDDDEDDDDE